MKDPDLLPCQKLLRNDQLMAFGCVAVESSSLELSLEAIISIFCKFDEEVGLLFLNRELRAKVELVNDLVKINAQGRKEILGDFKPIYDNICNLIPKRNTYIHGDLDPIINMDGSSIEKPMWRTGEVTSTRRRKGVALKPLHADEAMKVAKEISEEHKKLRLFVLGYFPEFLAQAGKST